MSHPEKLTADWVESWEKLLAQNLPFKVFLKGLDLTYLACNQNYAADHRITPREIFGRSDYDLYPRELAEKYRADDLHILETGRSETIEERYVRDSQEFHVQTIKSLFRDQSGEVIGILGTFWDISELKRVETALQVSEEQYRTLFETMAQGVVYQDAAGQITNANPAAERILGLSLDQMQGRTSVDLRWRAIHEDGSDFPGETHPAIVALATGREVHDVVMGVFNPAKEAYSWIMINAVPQFHPDEERPHRVYTTFDDITERKNAKDALRDGEERYRSLFEHMLDGYAYCKMIYDDQGHPVDFVYLDVNSAFKRLVGLESVVGKPVSEAIPGIREPYPELLESYGRVASTGKPEEFEIDFQSLNKWFSISVYSPAREYFVAVFDDITKRKQLEERIHQIRSDLLFAVSHDLKAPLQTLRQTQEMLGQLPPAEALARFQEYGEIWRRNLQRLERMINNLVDSQRVEEDRFPLLRAPCDPVEMVQRVVEDLAGYAPNQQVVFDLNLESVSQGSCDQEALSRVIENLLTNAVKFSPQGGRVEIRLGLEGDTLRLEVEDQGIGIPAQEQEQLFQPFQRSRSAKQKGIPGTGLGLYVCRRIVEEHGGTITLESEEGKGTTVTVRLPWSNAQNE